jgi:hypothetical protein
MKKQDKQILESILYTPLLVEFEDQSYLIIIYAYETYCSFNIDASGKKEKSLSDIVHILNISRTIESGNPVVYSCTIDNLSRFMQQVQKVDISTIQKELELTHSHVLSEMYELANRTQNLNKASSAINYSNKNKNDEHKNEESDILITTNDAGLAHIVFSTLKNTTKELTKEDVERIGGVIRDIITNHLEMNTDNQDEIRKLAQEVEYKIIETLPSNTVAGKINLNMDYIVSEIKSFQKRIGGQDNGNLQ